MGKRNKSKSQLFTSLGGVSPNSSQNRNSPSGRLLPPEFSIVCKSASHQRGILAAQAKFQLPPAGNASELVFRRWTAALDDLALSTLSRRSRGSILYLLFASPRCGSGLRTDDSSRRDQKGERLCIESWENGGKDVGLSRRPLVLLLFFLFLSTSTSRFPSASPSSSSLTRTKPPLQQPTTTPFETYSSLSKT